jgi:hypothetical protein
MSPYTSLDPTTARVLRLVKEQGVIRGAELLNRLAPAKEEDVSKAVQNLVSLELVMTKGDYSEPAALAEAYVTFRPSTSALADYAIRSSDVFAR